MDLTAYLDLVVRHRVIFVDIFQGGRGNASYEAGNMVLYKSTLQVLRLGSNLYLHEKHSYV
jgi:hypothetical protein